MGSPFLLVVRYYDCLDEIQTERITRFRQSALRAAQTKIYRCCILSYPAPLIAATISPRQSITGLTSHSNCITVTFIGQQQHRVIDASLPGKVIESGQAGIRVETAERMYSKFSPRANTVS